MSKPYISYVDPKTMTDKAMLAELEGEGVITRTRKALRRTAALPHVTVLDIPSDADPDNLHAFPAQWNPEEGEMPRVRVLTGPHARVVPAPGDRILARIDAGEDAIPNYTAKPMKVLDKPRRAQIGIVRKDAIPSGLKTAPLGLLEYIATVPTALCSSKKTPTLKEVLSTLPVAAQTTDGQFTQRLRDIAAGFGSELSPALACQSFPQTLVAVRSGAFAAILPEIALQSFDEGKILRVKGAELTTLNRPLALAWNPRAVRVRPNFSKLVDQLKHCFVL